MKKICVIILLVFTFSLADDIILFNGSVVSNVEITLETDNGILFNTFGENADLYQLPMIKVKEIIKTPFIKEKQSQGIQNIFTALGRTPTTNKNFEQGFSNTKNNMNKLPGDYLIKAGQYTYVSIGLSVAGSVLLFVNPTAGVLVSLVGTGVGLMAPNELIKAGRELNSKLVKLQDKKK